MANLADVQHLYIRYLLGASFHSTMLATLLVFTETGILPLKFKRVTIAIA